MLKMHTPYCCTLPIYKRTYRRLQISGSVTSFLSWYCCIAVCAWGADWLPPPLLSLLFYTDTGSHSWVCPGHLSPTAEIRFSTFCFHLNLHTSASITFLFNTKPAVLCSVSPGPSYSLVEGKASLTEIFISGILRHVSGVLVHSTSLCCSPRFYETQTVSERTSTYKRPQQTHDNLLPEELQSLKTSA